MGVQLSKLGLVLHWLILLVQVFLQGTAYAIPDYSGGPTKALCMWSRLDHLIPYHRDVNIFVLAGHIGGWGCGKGVVGWRQ